MNRRPAIVNHHKPCPACNESGSPIRVKTADPNGSGKINLYLSVCQNLCDACIDTIQWGQGQGELDPIRKVAYDY